ncbi:MAG: DUF721 domain-containing protein [Bacteroidota bacterium]
MKPYLSLGEAIQAFLDKHGLRQESKIQQIIAEWERLMGVPIAQNTEKVWFKGGVLYIKMSSPLWKNELQMARLKMQETLNRELGEEIIEEVRIV